MSRFILWESNSMQIRFEKKLWSKGYNIVAGVDEVGRGAWAGPIVAAAVALTKEQAKIIAREPWFKLVADSKVLSPKKREQVFEAAHGKVSWSVAVVESEQIDKMGIGNANRLVVEQAVVALPVRPNGGLCGQARCYSGWGYGAGSGRCRC